MASTRTGFIDWSILSLWWKRPYREPRSNFDLPFRRPGESDKDYWGRV